jgi:ATP-dependent DNA helicase RecQ
MMRRQNRDAGRKATSKGSKAVTVPRADATLFGVLKTLRLQLAAEAHVPPYVICHDRTLAELAGKRPRTEVELAGITGLGVRKIERYGARLLDAIARFEKTSPAH